MLPCHVLGFVPLATQDRLELASFGEREDAGVALCPVCLALLRVRAATPSERACGVKQVCATCDKGVVSSDILSASGAKGAVVYSGFDEAVQEDRQLVLPLVY